MKNTPNVSFLQEPPEMEFKKIKDLFDFIPAMKSKVVENKDGKSLLINRHIVHKKQVIDSTDELIRFDAKDDSGHVRGGDILFTTSGSKKDVGRASVIDLDNDNLYYGNFLFAFRPKGEYPAGYLAAVLNLPRTRQQIVKNGRASASFVNIKKDDLMNVKIQVYKDTAVNVHSMFEDLRTMVLPTNDEELDEIMWLFYRIDKLTDHHHKAVKQLEKARGLLYEQMIGSAQK